MPFRSEVAPSALCLGTGSFGSDISKEDSFHVLDAYVDGGGNFLDTAHIYAAWREGGWGASERTLGEWLRVHGNRRDLVIGTKGGHPPLDKLEQGRCSPECLEQDLTESLARLGIDYVDVYWLHRDDPAREVGEIMDTLAGFVQNGRIRSYGASNWPTARIAEANAYAAAKRLPFFSASQIGYALAERPEATIPVPGMVYMDAATKSWHESAGLTLAAYSPQARGYFSDANTQWAEAGFDGAAPTAAEYDTPANRARLEAAGAIARERGLTANQAALAYLRHQTFPVYPIIGTGNVDRLREALAAVLIVLTPEELARLRIEGG
jgi:aryl-alcohol dehydrogenase-like predicted oxidoreductase